MVFGCGPCNFSCISQCPPQHCWILPGSYRVISPGPVMSCAEDLAAVVPYSPCRSNGYGGYGGYNGYGGYGSYGGYGGYGASCGRGYGYGGYGCGGCW